MCQEPWKQKLKERMERTLHVRYTYKIKNIEEVVDLFTGDFTVKLPRQPSKNFHVEFSTVEEALQNKRALKGKIVYGKPIVIRRAYLNTLSGKQFRRKGKKVKIPDVEPDVKFTQSIFIGNLKCFTKADEIKDILPGCVSVTLLKPYTNTLRSAIVRMESMELAAEYLLKKREWPCLHGNRLILKCDTRTKHKNKSHAKVDNAGSKGSVKNKTSTVEIENNFSSY